MTDEELQAAIDEAVAMQTADEKLKALERLRKSVIDERRLLRFLTVLAIVVGSVGVGLAVQSRGVAKDAKEAAASAEQALVDFKAERSAARRGSCLQYNEQQARAREGNNTQLRVVFDGLTAGRATTPEGQARLAALYAAHDSAMVTAFPDRDCTPEGIEAYLKANG